MAAAASQKQASDGMERCLRRWADPFWLKQPSPLYHSRGGHSLLDIAPIIPYWEQYLTGGYLHLGQEQMVHCTDDLRHESLEECPAYVGIAFQR